MMQWKLLQKEQFKKKAAEATGDLIGNKIAYKITSLSNKSSKHSQNDDANNEIEVPKERFISPEKIQQTIDELWLV